MQRIHERQDTQINVFLRPSANNPTPTCPMVDANMNLLPVANQYFARANYQYNMGWNDTSMTPAAVNYDDPVLGCNGPLYRNSRVLYAGVTDELSNTVFASEKTPYLADASWVGIIPGYRHFAFGAFASLGTGGLGVNYDYPGAILPSHSGPSLYEDHVVIHPPNRPLGHTDEFFSLHPGGANVLIEDGSVRFVKQAINLLAWQAFSSRSNGEIISADSYRTAACDQWAPGARPLIAMNLAYAACGVARRLRRAIGSRAREPTRARGPSDGHLAQEPERAGQGHPADRGAPYLWRALRRRLQGPPGHHQEDPGWRLGRGRETGL